MASLVDKEFVVVPATVEDFDLIKEYIQKFELDNRDLHYYQFTVAKQNDKIVGFVRTRNHKGCDEICSLGVIETKRFNGIAKALVLEKIKKSTQAIYLVCIIPNFFELLGFKIVGEYPPEMQDKLDYCTSELIVEEPYVVMKKTD